MIFFNAKVAETAEKSNRIFQLHENEISKKIISAAIEVNRILCPGLLESVYEDALYQELHLRGLRFIRQLRRTGLRNSAGICVKIKFVQIIATTFNNT